MILPSMILLFFFVASRLRVRLLLSPRASNATVTRPFFPFRNSMQKSHWQDLEFLADIFPP
jgi:hypothetical protein